MVDGGRVDEGDEEGRAEVIREWVEGEMFAIDRSRMSGW